MPFQVTWAIFTPYWANIASYNDINPDCPTAAAALGSSKVYASYQAKNAYQFSFCVKLNVSSS